MRIENNESPLLIQDRVGTVGDAARKGVESWREAARAEEQELLVVEYGEKAELRLELEATSLD